MSAPQPPAEPQPPAPAAAPPSSASRHGAPPPVVGSHGGTGRAATRPLSEAARRALAEAEARRRAATDLGLAPEHGGRTGPEPVRFGDWEVNGLATDF